MGDSLVFGLGGRRHWVDMLSVERGEVNERDGFTSTSQHFKEIVDVKSALHSLTPRDPLNEFYKKGCQEKKLRFDRRPRRFCRDPAHFTVRVPLDLRERFCF